MIMKRIRILRWNVLSRLYEKRSTELQVYACVAIFFARPTLLTFPATAVQERNNCPVHIPSSGERMPTQWRDCQFTDKAIGVVPCSHAHSEIQTFFSICHFSTCDSLSLSPAPHLTFLGCSLAILALTQWHSRKIPVGFARARDTHARNLRRLDLFFSHVNFS